MRQPTKKNLLEQLSAAAFADLGRICTVETDGDMQAIHIKDTSELTKPERLALCQIKAHRVEALRQAKGDRDDRTADGAV